MHVQIGDRRREGRAIDLTGTDVSPATVVRAIGGTAGRVRVDCPPPSDAHEHVARLPPETFDRRAALAAAARALGHTSSVRSALEAARTELDELSPSAVDVETARRRVAETGETEERLRERVAELRGRLQARRQTGADATAVKAQLDEAVRRLSEAETERIAAEQALERAEEAARVARDRRDRRLELEDRVANLEREMRRELADTVWEQFRAALRTVPGDATAGTAPGTYEGDRLTAALAVARVAPLHAPVVVDGCDRFDGAESVASTLDAPVIYIG